ncbi:hypothetical protein HLK59_10190 [Streptomyces sp. S3(2020)]|uniref:hypothetical protein n=1 Tax=Streptomyces sp. S3(2020) TaxID=2732044 RepID=UPI0014882142|nr:hypothetical protein [Streptomyces sp. S3(2020)]NNN30726.1 hypothetical protein [Streptomyces sp. S3(2020)]
MPAPSARPMQQAGQAWLLSCAPDPAAVRSAWELEQFAQIPTGAHWLVAEAPLVRSVQATRRIPPDRLGPVLGDVHRDVAWWLLPADAAQELDDIRQIVVHPAGWILSCPPVLHSLEGRWWVEPPDGTGQLTDPSSLGAAFGPGGRPSREAFG